VLKVPAAGPGRSPALATIHDAIDDTASALAELHTVPSGSGGPVSPDYIEGYIHGTRGALEEVAQRRAMYEPLGLDVDQMRARVELAAARFLGSPGGAALAHGDAHPGNFFFDGEARRLTFIDMGTAHVSMDANGSPIGSPARDFANFEQRLGHLSHDHDPTLRVELQSRFREAYHAAGGPPLSEDGLTLFRARAALHRLLDVTPSAPAPNRPATWGQASAADITRVERYVGLVKEALGLHSARP
jgi:aminoglycoside phosphotransferase (APT) family kinase protein